jgi:hypothetical protein
MKPDEAELLANEMTQCYASTLGCKKLPVRMIVELPSGPDIADAEFVMLCVVHAATYKPTGKVIADQMLVSDENLKVIQDIGA